jgi:hypothetical protein
MDLPIHPDDRGGWIVYDSLAMNGLIATFSDRADAERYVLMRKAEDVMMRRGWTVTSDEVGIWRVEDINGVSVRGFHGPDPFAALVEAESSVVT